MSDAGAIRRYMVIERFTAGAAAVYERAERCGRLLPPGLVYVDSWVDEQLGRCFQLMETDDPSLFARWTAEWDDLGGVRDRPPGVVGRGLGPSRPGSVAAPAAARREHGRGPQ